MCPTTDPPLDRLPVAAFMGGRRQHGVLSGQPAESGSLPPARDAAGHRCGAEHLRATEFHQYGAGRMCLEAAGEADRAKFVVGPSILSDHPSNLVPAMGRSFGPAQRASVTPAISGP